MEARESAARAAASREGTAHDRAATVVLLGRTGAGKSSVGNTLLGHPDYFRVAAGPAVVTQECKIGSVSEAENKWRSLRVIDTPGLGQDEKSDEEVMNEIYKSIQIASEAEDHGIDALLLVMDISARTSPSDLSTVEQLQKAFGYKAIRSRGLVVWVNADRLKGQGKVSESDCMALLPLRLREVVAELGGRSVVMDPTAPALSLRSALDEMLRQVPETPYRTDDAPRRMTIKQARRMRQAAQLRRATEESEAERQRVASMSWGEWLVDVVAPMPTGCMPFARQPRQGSDEQQQQQM